jgi:hypothetical protein
VPSLDEFLERPDVARIARRVAERTPLAVQATGNERYAAIALTLRPSADGEPELLMIRRAEFEGDPWSGHIACPGGRMEPSDIDLAYTAMHEPSSQGRPRARRRILGARRRRRVRRPPLVIALSSRSSARRRDHTERRSRRSILGSALGVPPRSCMGPSFMPIRGLG